MDEILVAEELDHPPEKFDFSSPEDVLIEVVGPHDDNPANMDWKNWSIESTTIINQAKADVTGAASYEASYGGFLAYTVQDMIDCPGEGWFVVVGVTGTYHKGEWGFTDDDMDFEFDSVRLATPDEISLA